MATTLTLMEKLIRSFLHNTNIGIIVFFILAILGCVPSYAEGINKNDFYSKIGSGKYSEAILHGKQYIKFADERNSWDSPYERARFIAAIGRYSSFYTDNETSLWSNTELSKFLDDKSHSHSDIMNIALNSDVNFFSNMAVLLDQRQKTIESLQKVVVSKFLTDNENIHLLLETAKFYMQSGDWHSAELFTHRALAIAAFSKNVNGTEVARIIIGLAFIYAEGGRTSILDDLVKLIAKLEKSGSLNTSEPYILEIYNNLLKVNINFAPVNQSQKIMNLFKKHIAVTGIEVPLIYKIELFINEAIIKALSGDISFFKNIENKFKKEIGVKIGANPNAEIVLRIIKIYAKLLSSNTLSKDDIKLLSKKMDKSMEGFRRLAQLEILLKSTSNNKEISNAIDNLTDALVDASKSGAGKFSYIRQPSIYEQLTRKILFTSLSSKYKNSLPKSISISVVRLLHKISGLKADFMTRGRIEIENATEPELKIQVKRFLKLSEEREFLTLKLADRAVDNVISFVKNDFKYTEQNIYDNFISNDFRRLDSQLASIEKYISNTDEELLNRIFFPDIDANDIVSVLKNGDVFFFYEVSGNHIFSCYADSFDINCNIRKFDSIKFNSDLNILRMSINDPSRSVSTFSHKSAYSIYSQIFGKNLDHKKIQKLYLQPSGIHLAVPFNALITQKNNDKSYLGLKHGIVLVPSISALFFGDNSTGNNHSKEYLGLGNPQYSLTQLAEINVDKIFSTVRSGTNIDDLKSLPSLPETKLEVLESSNDVPDSLKTILLDEVATEINVRKQNLDDYKVLHFATHGLVSGEFKGLSQPALVFGLNDVGNESYRDGVFTANEISEYSLNSDLVILSACQTATDYGKPNISGFNGLTSAFLSAGSKRVLGSQWKVESKSAAILISQATKQILNNNIDPEVALLNSMRSLQKNQEYSHPYYWASFIISGGINTNKKPEINYQNKFTVIKRKNFSITEGSIEFTSVKKVENGFVGSGLEFEYGDKRAKGFIFNVNKSGDLKKTYSQTFGLRTIKASSSPNLYLGTEFNDGDVVPIIVRFDKSGSYETLSKLRFNNFTTSILHKISQYRDGYVSILEGIEKTDGTGEWKHDLVFFDKEFSVSKRMNINYVEKDGDIISFNPKIFTYENEIYLYISPNEKLKSMPPTEKSSYSNEYNFITGEFSCLVYPDTHVYKFDENKQKFLYEKLLPKFVISKIMPDKKLYLLGSGKCGEASLQVRDYFSGKSHDLVGADYDYRFSDIINIGEKGWVAAGSLSYKISNLEGFGEKTSYKTDDFLSSTIFMGSNNAKSRVLFLINKNFKVAAKKVVPSRTIALYGPLGQIDEDKILAFGLHGRNNSFLEILSVPN